MDGYSELTRKLLSPLNFFCRSRTEGIKIDEVTSLYAYEW